MDITRTQGLLRTLLALIRLFLLFIAALILATELGLALRPPGLGLAWASLFGENPGTSQASSQPRLGVNVALEQYDEGGRRRALDRLRGAGFTWVR